ncbi:MAG: hypothetical protein JRH18_16970 [Deltaproteobacteria bacterium]|nr:hypothetical protein [Deltaproteobacteria bacterium]MBW1962678.1 hypothetical protein [Deltaproteobacteria bacterium]MBW1993058.1 hypothetical protein [Deltaproteobacteria bacterium]MBW2153350.1 hypothetical protein [Deltaproteobacteria bacterium]
MTEEQLYDLLGTRHIPGTAEQLRILCTRMSELLELKGEVWVRANREKLISEWEYALRYLISASS